MAESAYHAAYQQAIRLLSQREHSRSELAQKISRKQDDTPLEVSIEKAARWFTDHGYLD